MHCCHCTINAMCGLSPSHAINLVIANKFFTPYRSQDYKSSWSLDVERDGHHNWKRMLSSAHVVARSVQSCATEIVCWRYETLASLFSGIGLTPTSPGATKPHACCAEDWWSPILSNACTCHFIIRLKKGRTTRKCRYSIIVFSWGKKEQKAVHPDLNNSAWGSNNNFCFSSLKPSNKHKTRTLILL